MSRSAPNTVPDVSPRETPRLKIPVGVVQRVVARYRVPVFQTLAARCDAGFSVFGAAPTPHEAVPAPAEGPVGFDWYRATNRRWLSGPLRFYSQRGLDRWLDEHRPAVVIAEANPRLLSTPAVVKWARRNGCGVVGWGLGMQLSSPLFASLRRSRRSRFMQMFDAVLTYSAIGAEQYKQTGIPADRIFIAHNATSPRPTAQPSRNPASPDQPPTVLFVGKLTQAKHVDRLLEACAAIPAQSAPRLLIVGDGPDRDRLTTLAARTCPSAQLLGSRFGEDLDRLYAQADLFVLPGLGGLAIQQAMAHALPVLVTRADGTEKDLVGPANGRIVEPTAQALAQAIPAMLRDREQLRQMGQRSFELVRDRYNVDEMVNQMIAAIETANRRRESS